MRIYLYLANEILEFSIPKEISGSFSFDENPEEETKLINIEARNGSWELYSTEDIKVIVDNNIVSSTPLRPDTYYILRRNELNYLIFVEELFEKNIATYVYRTDINMIIGNSPECNIEYPCEYINKIACTLKFFENRLLLENAATTQIYINRKNLNGKAYYIKNGDQINIFGLKLTFFNGLLLINNPKGQVKVDQVSSKLSAYYLSDSEPPKDLEFKDAELYTKEDYFSKSPRLRRVTETKHIDLSPPPREDNNKDLPMILTIGPMLTMGVMALVMLLNTANRLYLGETTIEQSWPSLITSGAMLVSMLVWPLLTKRYNKKQKEKQKKETIEKYNKYLNEKREELTIERKIQKDILIENLITIDECLNIIQNNGINFWDKRIDQSDFLVVRIGKGNELLDVEINYPEQGFTIEESELRKNADKLVEEFKYIENVPIGYSLYKNRITAIMGNMNKSFAFTSNIILQLITFYSYEDIKIAIFTNEKNESEWDYVKYLNHNFSNDRSFRFFAPTVESAKNLADFFNIEVNNRVATLQNNGNIQYKPHYVIIIDDYDRVKRHNFIKVITELDTDLGFSVIIVEKHLNKLPSKCNNFISLGDNTSGVLKNSYEKQEQITFYDEINYAIDMMSITKKLSNIPIEFQEGNKQLPETITFLEMEKVGKVEQLNILNRWNMNDPTASLKAEVGVDEEGNFMYLDLHEKFHGPHGLIAGMTGSGKSEFIITYILSMAINYSPDEVAFILIDYKGGGLAFAFENKTTGVSLPHLAGTITNLDKAEMDRTLVSIDSEVKRRQRVFNEARDELGESTIDIYKYQRFYREGKLQEPVPHLFIVCDEFAELKSQQPGFMDNLISIARIGRSLGVHLILATQKPTGVVNDQIWSNSKFRVCLKVQDESDSKEMLKRPDAAGIKQTGRFFLQVGYDEYFALGQSAWCGAKYYPSEKIIKQVDKSLNFIDDTGNFIKSIQAGNNIKIEAQGEQLAAIMKNIIATAKQCNKKANRLWLDNIPELLLMDDLMEQYQITPTPYHVKAILGKYDAPEKQEQGLLEYDMMAQGNTIIYGNDSAEREMVLNSIILSSCMLHKTEELHIYGVDYGSEAMRVFHDFPQMGGMAYMGEDEKLKNVFKLITEEIKLRKKKLVSYGGSIESYNEANEEKLPVILFILNNYEGITEIYQDIYEDIASLTRDCHRYGIIFMITCNAPSSIGRRVNQNFDNAYTLHLTDPSDYFSVFNVKSNTRPRDIFGRGLTYNDGVHEFQAASIVDEEHSLTDYIKQIAEKLKESNQKTAPPIPSLPERVTLEAVKEEIKDLAHIPIGIAKDSLKVIKYDFLSYPATIISSNKLENINSFIDSLVDVLNSLSDVTVVFIDTMQTLEIEKSKQINYINENFGAYLDKLLELQEKQKNNTSNKIVYIFYGLEKLKTKIDSTSKLEKLFQSVKRSENTRLIICDSGKALKSLDYDTWYSDIKNATDGIWIGRGFADQQNFRISKVTKEMSVNYANNYGWYISESSAELMKVIEFNETLNKGEDDDEE